MSEQSDFNAAYSVIAEAAELLLRCAGFLDDHDEGSRKDERHWDIYYAVDADVFPLYLEPDRSVSYADVFGGNTSESTKINLTLLLGDFLFKSAIPLVPNLSQKCRFLLIPPHDEELLKILSAIHRDLGAIPGTINLAKFEALSTALEEYRLNGNEKSLLNALSIHVPELAELNNPYQGPRAALTRYALLPETTFQRIETYRENNFAFPLLDPINNRADRKIAEPLMGDWESLLKKHKRSMRQPARAIRTDAEVLATVQHVNSHLRYERKKLVLVTGSHYLFDAAGTFKPWPEDERTFGEMYLRHPQAFLANPKFFLLPGEEKAQFKLIDWLNLFFPSGFRPVQSPGVVNRALLREITKGGNSSVRQVIHLLTRWGKGAQPIEGLIKGWQAQVDSVAKARYADGVNKAGERGVRRLAEQLAELRKQNKWTVENLRALVYDESLGSISKLYSTTVWVGLWSKAGREQSKGIPALRFDDKYKEIEPYCEEVIRLQLKDGVTSKELERLQKLNEDLEAADKTLYHAHVIHALAFAVKGHYHATLTLAKTAMAICDNIEPQERGFLQGREAAYLACISARRSVRGRQGLEEASRFLDEAIHKRENPGAAEDIRFAAERLAIRTRSVYLNTFYDGTDLDVRVVSAILEGSDQLLEQVSGEENARVRHWVLRQTLTNYFSLALMARELAPTTNLPHDEKIATNLKILGEILADREYGRARADDPFAHLIFDICTAKWGASQETREDAATAAREALTAWKPTDTPWESGRLEFLKGCITGGARSGHIVITADDHD